MVLGFSKGPTQAGALSKTPHDAIAYKGSRGNVGKILKHIGLLSCRPDSDLAQEVSQLISDKSGRFHFGSLIRCTVERCDKGVWKGSGGGMLDKFVATDFGQEVAGNCTSKFLNQLPENTKLVVMFGLGSKLNYVGECHSLYKAARKGFWTKINDVAYTDNRITVVHVEHFAAQGALITQWLGERDHPRKRYGLMAKEAVIAAIGHA